MRRENRSTRRKTSRSRVENQLTQPTYGFESGNRSRVTLVVVSALTTAATLLPLTSPYGWLQAKLIKEEFDVHSGGPSKAYSRANKTTLTDSSFYVYHVEFDELLKETERGSRIIVSKYPLSSTL